MLTRDAHREAFRRYLRHGTPMRLSFKEEPSTTHYVWRTRRDERVRSSHREFDGHLIAWDDPPEVGHPGHEPNCRCVAIPYVRSRTEYAAHEITTNVTRMVRRWDDADFVGHFYTGGGRAVALREIGHLGEVVDRFSYRDGDEGALRRLSDQIATRAREVVDGPFEYPFGQSYDFEGVAFSHGDAVVRGTFRGRATDRGRIISIMGTIEYTFEDRFTDPLDLRERAAVGRRNRLRLYRALRRLSVRLGIEARPLPDPEEVDPDDVSRLLLAISEVGGTAYEINGAWRSTFRGEVFKNGEVSYYQRRGR